MSDASAALDRIKIIWPAIADQLGVPPRAHNMKLLQARMDDTNPRLIVLLEGDGVQRFILKRNLVCTHINHFNNIIAAHGVAYRAFEGQARLRVPTLRYVDSDRQMIVMDHAPGLTAHDALSQAVRPEDRTQVLRDCGAWIGHFHRATYARDNQISPNTMQKFVARRRDRVREGSLLVTDPQSFISCCDIAIAKAEAERGKTTKIAATHGDMNLRNLITGPEGTWGIDFGAVHAAPIGHDLARFFINFANFHYPDNAEEDPNWFARDLEDLNVGYGLETGTDPSFDYLLGTQMLKDWASIPANPLRRNSLHKRRWKGLKILRSILFPET